MKSGMEAWIYSEIELEEPLDPQWQNTTLVINSCMASIVFMCVQFHSADQSFKSDYYTNEMNAVKTMAQYYVLNCSFKKVRIWNVGIDTVVTYRRTHIYR